MKRRRCHSAGTGVPLGLRQILDEVVDTFVNLKKNVRNWLQDENRFSKCVLPAESERHGQAINQSDHLSEPDPRTRLRRYASFAWTDPQGDSASTRRLKEWCAKRMAYTFFR